MLKSGIGATEGTLRERAAAPRRRAQPRRQPRRRHRAVQRQQRQPRAAPELHRQPARHSHKPFRHRSGTPRFQGKKKSKRHQAAPPPEEVTWRCEGRRAARRRGLSGRPPSGRRRRPCGRRRGSRSRPSRRFGWNPEMGVRGRGGV